MYSPTPPRNIYIYIYTWCALITILFVFAFLDVLIPILLIYDVGRLYSHLVNL